MAAGKLDPPSWCNVSVEELQLAKEAFKTGGKDGILTFFKHKLDEWKNVDINIAIIGDAGQGKSTFINTIRGLRADDDGAARVDVTQTTCELWPYLHPNNEQLTFWDLPGLNTPDYTRDNYFEMISFQAFDFYLLVSATRLKDDDKWLAGEIEKRGRKFFFIRPKVHIDIHNDRYDHPRSKDDPNQPTYVLQRIMGEIEGRLAPLQAERGRNVFLVDSQHPRHYDFPTLQRRLIEQLPTGGP